MNNTILNDLIHRATAARENAYAPYSRFLVGAAVLAKDGSVHVGCNVENASYGLTQCAERAAVTAAIADGVRELDVCLIVTDTPTPTMPCGACRQVLREFGVQRVISVTLDGAQHEVTMSALLPDAFLGDNLP